MKNTALSECDYNQMEYFLDNPTLIKKYKKEFGLMEDESFENYYPACCPSGEQKWHGEFNRIYLPKGEFETAPIGNLRHKKPQMKLLKNSQLKLNKCASVDLLAHNSKEFQIVVK